MAQPERLADLYWELQTDEEPIGLEEFVNRAVAGAYGAITREELRECLRAVEGRLVTRIERGEGSAHHAVGREELIDETRAWIDDLVSKFCEG